MEFRILGPLEAVADGRVVAPDAAKPRALLAILLLRAGEPVSRDRLIEELWDGRPPSSATKVLQTYVSQLRKALGSERDRHPPFGLRARRRCRIGFDLHRFERLVAEARSEQAGRRRPGACGRRSRSGEGRRWPTSPTSGGRSPRSSRLEELRLEALQERIETDLALGRERRARRRARAARRPVPAPGAPARPAHARPLPLGKAGGRARGVSRCEARARGDARHRADARAPAARAPDPRPGSVARSRYRRAAGRRCCAAGAELAESLVVVRRAHARAAGDPGASSPRGRAAPDVDGRRRVGEDAPRARGDERSRGRAHRRRARRARPHHRRATRREDDRR